MSERIWRAPNHRINKNSKRERNFQNIGNYTVEIPANWSDRTIFSFVAPRIVDPRQSPHLRMGGGFRENLSISRERITQTDPAQYLRRQIEELKPKLYRMNVLEERALTIASRPAYTISYKFTLRAQKLDLCQIRIAVSFPDEILVFTGTSAAHVFEQKKQERS